MKFNSSNEKNANVDQGNGYASDDQVVDFITQMLRDRHEYQRSLYTWGKNK